MTIVTMDAKGRVSIPKELRQELGVQAGDVFFIRNEDGTLRLAKVTNPFDGLALHAIAEYEAGRTRSLRDFAREENVSLDEDGASGPSS